MAYTKQNFEDGQVLTAEHLNNMETELAREKSWNELADKPFGDVYGDTVTFDGNPNGVNVEEMVFKVSDAVPTYADVTKGGYIIASGEKVPFTAEELLEEETVLPEGILCVFSTVFIVPPAMAGVESESMGITFPEAGTYFYYAQGMLVTELQLNEYSGFLDVKPIDKKYVPTVTYDELPDKPFGVFTGNELEWNGQTTEITSTNEVFRLLSTSTPSVDELVGAYIKVSNGGVLPVSCNQVNSGLIAVKYGTTELLLIVSESNLKYETSIFPAVGIYVNYTMTSFKFITPNFPGWAVTKTLDEKYLPTIPVEKLPGAIILYDDNLHLYSDEAETIKITREQFMRFFLSGVTIILKRGTWYGILYDLDTLNDYVIANFRVRGATVVCYTAEYTRE